jgi:hypothetical protein
MDVKTTCIRKFRESNQGIQQFAYLLLIRQAEMGKDAMHIPLRILG